MLRSSLVSLKVRPPQVELLRRYSCLALTYASGATIGWTLALSGWSRANLLAGLVLVSGRAMPECLQSSSALGKRLVSRGELSRRPPVLAAHGERDGVTPLSFGQQSAALGRKAGLNVDYIEHEVTHNPRRH